MVNVKISLTLRVLQEGQSTEGGLQNTLFVRCKAQNWEGSETTPFCYHNKDHRAFQ